VFDEGVKKVQFELKRKNWDNEWKNLNMTSIKRIALLSLEKRGSSGSKVHKAWISLHGGIPSEVKSYGKGSNETLAIKKSTIDKFVSERNFWNTKEVIGSMPNG
jgi:hypothetical protein